MRKLFLLTLAIGVAAAVDATAMRPGFAHTPHDVIADVAVSPAYATDHTVVAISDNRGIRSTDGGKHWKEMAVGLTGEPLARLAFAPTDSQIIYLSSRGGGMYRSDDQGLSWRSTSTGPAMTHLAEFAVSPTDPDTVVAAAGLLGGLFRTADGGESWNQVEGIGKIDAVLYVPDHPGRVLIGGADGSIALSDDDGATFTRVGASARGAGVTAMAADPSGETLFAGTRSGKVLRSRAAGKSWKKFGAGLPDQPVTSLAVSNDYSTDKMLWAATWNDGVFRSRNGARAWQPRFKGLTGDRQAGELGLPVFLGLAIAPNVSGAQRLFVAGYDGLFKSTVNGSRWRPVETLSEYVTGLAVSPAYAEDGTVVVSTYLKGVFISRNRGASFKASNRGLEHRISDGNKLLPLRRMHNIVFSPAYAEDRTIFTTVWDGFVKSTNAGKSWKSVRVSPPPAGGNLRQFVIGVSPAYATDQTIFLGSRQGIVYRSTKGGAKGSWRPQGDLGGRVRSIAVSPDFELDQTLLISTEDGMSISTDAGDNWKPTGPPGIAVLAISPNFGNDRTVFAGTENGLLVTGDAGASWLPTAALADANIEAVALSPDFASAPTVLVSVAGTGLFRSTNGGRSFAPTGDSLTEGGLVIADFENPTSSPIQFSPTFATDRTIYAYGQQSVVRSTDGGDSWEVLTIPSAKELARQIKRVRK